MTERSNPTDYLIEYNDGRLDYVCAHQVTFPESAPFTSAHIQFMGENAHGDWKLLLLARYDDIKAIINMTDDYDQYGLQRPFDGAGVVRLP
jgi:hypothetical protein